MQFKTETKVGLFTLIGLAVFTMVMMFLSHANIFGPSTMTVVGKFSSVNGLKDGNSVRYSGVPVGKVKAISVGPEGVIVTMEIDKNSQIPNDSMFSLQTDGLLGEKFISITPGKDESYIKNGDYIKAKGSDSVDETVGQMNKVLVEAEKLLGSLNKVAGDPTAQAAMKATLGNTGDITSNLANLTKQMNTLLVQNQANINAIAANMAEVSQNMNKITTQLNTSVHRIDGDGKSSENIRNILQNLQESTAALNSMARSMEGVVSDEQTVKDIKTTLHNVSHISGVVSTMTGGKSEGISGEGGMSMLYRPKDGQYDPNFDYAITTDKSKIAIGVHHIGNDSALELNYGKNFNDKLILKGGIFDGQLGVGFDWGKDSYRISGAIMNINDLQYRLSTQLRLSNNLNFVGQFYRPFTSKYGGDYYGIQYRF